jgi:hypothetical protein
MAKLPISYHERAEGHPHRWRVLLTWDAPVRVMQTHFIA